MNAFLRVRPAILLLLALCFMSALWGCQPHKPDTGDNVPADGTYEVFGKQYTPVDSADRFHEKGIASWYGHPFHGRKTSNGERYNMNAKTAAHPTLPMGTFLLVRNLENNKETVVRINDRGPFAKNRIIDLSYRSAKAIDMVQNGTARVEIMTVDAEADDFKERIRAEHPDFYTGDFTLQVGAYTDKDKAYATAEKLKAFETEVFVKPVTVDGRNIYRVQVGRFADRGDAEKMKALLAQNGYDDVFAVSAGE